LPRIHSSRPPHFPFDSSASAFGIGFSASCRSDLERICGKRSSGIRAFHTSPTTGRPLPHSKGFC
jgi:hypothetical protein